MTIALILTGCKGPSSLDPDMTQPENNPIKFAVTCDLSVESKAIITDPTGFVALGGLTTLDAWKTNAVFGANGTAVSKSNNAWTYSPVRYWQPGSYVFAGVMPSTLSCTASLSENNHKQMTLDFGASGFNLAEAQTDLLVAFDEVDVTRVADAGSVDFVFAHQFAWVVIRGASVDPATKGIHIHSIKVYGNSAATEGNMVFTYSSPSETNPTGLAVNYALTSLTDVDTPYKTILAPTGENLLVDQDWALEKPGTNGLVYDTLVPELLVFPEQCTFSIAVTYVEEGNTKTRVGSLSADWKAGKKYTYTFNLATDISFSVDVREWGEETVNDTPIEII